MRPNSPSTRCRKTYVQASDSRCFSKDTSGGNRKPLLPFQAGDALCSAPLRALSVRFFAYGPARCSLLNRLQLCLL
jgi:hypothetical protein